jgi:hypothetical protein
MPLASQIVDRHEAVFRVNATCQHCDWERFAYGTRSQLLNLQNQARRHAHDDQHEVIVDVHKITSYTPITRTLLAGSGTSVAAPKPLQETDNQGMRMLR